MDELYRAGGRDAISTEIYFREIMRLAAEVEQLQETLAAIKKRSDVYFEFTSQVEASHRFFRGAREDWRRTCEDVEMTLSAALLDQEAKDIRDARTRLSDRIAQLKKNLDANPPRIAALPTLANSSGETGESTEDSP